MQMDVLAGIFGPPAMRCLYSTVVVLHPRPGEVSIAERRLPVGAPFGSSGLGGRDFYSDGLPLESFLASPLPPPPGPFGGAQQATPV
jgi:hypothetical protein